MTTAARKSTIKKKKVLSAKERADLKLKVDHRKLVRAVLSGAGYKRVTGVSDKEFTYDNQKSDFDDIFVFENVIVLAEYTTSQSSAVGTYLKSKKSSTTRLWSIRQPLLSS